MGMWKTILSINPDITIGTVGKGLRLERPPYRNMNSLLDINAISCTEKRMITISVELSYEDAKAMKDTLVAYLIECDKEPKNEHGAFARDFQ